VGQRLREAGDGQTGRSGAVGDRLNGFWGTETRAARAGGYLARQDLRKKPIYLRKEFPPCREPTPSGSLSRGVYLIGQGVLRVADADDAVSWGPGLRWGIMGPSLLWRIGGDAGFHGTPHGPDGWLDENSRNPDITPDLKRTITEGVVQEAESFCRATREGRKRVVAWTS
jgi:hypothetical protein